jgi:hypothetical protein
MDANRKAQLTAAGIDVDAALSRFMGQDRILERYFGRFPSEASYAGIVREMEAQNYPQAREYAHAFKGIVGSLGFTELWQISIAFEGHLKKGEIAEALAKYPALQVEYERICQVLQS